MLINRGAEIAKVDNWDQNALMCAVFIGDKEICELLINHGAEISTINKSGHTALTIAAFKGHKEICELLIKAGDDLLAEGLAGVNALNVAALNGHKETALFLLNVNPDLVLQKPNVLTALKKINYKHDNPLLRKKARKEHLLKFVTHLWGLKGSIPTYSGITEAEGWVSYCSSKAIKKLWNEFCVTYDFYLSEETKSFVLDSLTPLEIKELSIENKIKFINSNYLEVPNKPILINIGFNKHAAYMWICNNDIVLVDGGTEILYKKYGVFGGLKGEIQGKVTADLLIRLDKIKDMEMSERDKELSTILDEINIKFLAKRDCRQRVGNCSVHNLINVIPLIFSSPPSFIEQYGYSFFKIGEMFIPFLKMRALNKFIQLIDEDERDDFTKGVLPYLKKIKQDLPKVATYINPKNKSSELGKPVLILAKIHRELDNDLSKFIYKHSQPENPTKLSPL